MENKNVGWLVIGIAAAIVVIIFIFNSALRDIVVSSCSMEKSVCPMYKTIDQQTYLALAIVAVLAVIGFVLMFSKPNEKIVVKRITEKTPKKEFDLSGFNKEEKTVFNLVKDNRAIFQADLIEKAALGKAKISRILDRLEGKGYIERKRRGMNNIVVLKED